jgi:rubrerythrin
MFTADHFRAKTAEYTALLKDAVVPNEISDLQKLEHSFSSLAHNEDWLADNFDKIIHSQDAQARTHAVPEIEEHILRCLGAAVIMEWNTIPTKLKRELFDTAASMGELLQTAELRAQIARFLYDHKDDEWTSGSGRQNVRPNAS